MKNRLLRYDINRPTSRQGHKYSEYKKWGWVEKSVAYQKSV